MREVATSALLSALNNLDKNSSAAGIGIAGVAPKATLVALKACSVAGFCFVDEVAAALRYAGDHHIDIVNLSLFADLYLYYCGNDAQQRGVLIVAAAGNEEADLRHLILDTISPDWPPDTAVERDPSLAGPPEWAYGRCAVRFPWRRRHSDGRECS